MGFSMGFSMGIFMGFDDLYGFSWGFSMGFSWGFSWWIWFHMGIRRICSKPLARVGRSRWTTYWRCTMKMWPIFFKKWGVNDDDFCGFHGGLIGVFMMILQLSRGYVWPICCLRTQDSHPQKCPRSGHAGRCQVAQPKFVWVTSREKTP